MCYVLVALLRMLEHAGAGAAGPRGGRGWPPGISHKSDSFNLESDGYACLADMAAKLLKLCCAG